jgi:hypothetical protein
MNSDQRTISVSINDLWRTALRRLAWLRAKIKIGINVAQALQDSQGVIESLPLSTSEFGLASNRLQNAANYLASGEPGAARYELQLLETSLRLWSGVLPEELLPLRRSRNCNPSQHS